MILLQYGLQKSGSTFLTRVANEMANLQGSNQSELRTRISSGDDSLQWGFWSPAAGDLAEIAKQISGDEILVLKCHESLSPRLKDLIDTGIVVPLICYRHPGDAALSAFEAGVKARAEGRTDQGFHRLDTHMAAIHYTCQLAENVTLKWLQAFPNNCIEYQALTRDDRAATSLIEKLLGINLDPAKVHEAVEPLYSRKTKVYNFNKGVSGRYRDIFDSEETKAISDMAPNYIRHCGYEVEGNRPALG